MNTKIDLYKMSDVQLALLIVVLRKSGQDEAADEVQLMFEARAGEDIAFEMVMAQQAYELAA